MELSIPKKLFILFSFFILIFYGTVFDLFLRVKHMSQTSARIVQVHNPMADLCKSLGDGLVDMEINDKKFRLLKKPLYFKAFEKARRNYNHDLERIILLGAEAGLSQEEWIELRRTYGPRTVFHPMDNRPRVWASDEILSQWGADIEAAGRANGEAIHGALVHIDDLSRKSVRNGAIGFGISILVGGLGIWFIFRAMVKPLTQLKWGLAQVSDDNFDHEIPVRSRDEFGELATAFNHMSRQLKADDEIRSDFIATLSHEIRTPLSSIRESVNLLTEEVLGPVNEKQNKFLTLAASEITRLTQLLNYLLDNSPGRVSVGKTLPLDPNALVKEAVARLEAQQKDVNLVFRSPRGLPRVMGEKKALLQVLGNILGNAVKFSRSEPSGSEASRSEPSGSEPFGARVEILISRPSQDFLAFHICDQGPGIPRGKQELIFKKYYRAKDVRKHTDGVGLGLNIAKGIVRAHGGQIWVKNNQGRGCTFTFTLPVGRKI